MLGPCTPSCNFGEIVMSRGQKDESVCPEGVFPSIPHGSYMQAVTVRQSTLVNRICLSLTVSGWFQLELQITSFTGSSRSSDIPYPRDTTSLSVHEDVIAGHCDEVLRAAHVRVLSILAAAEMLDDRRHLKHERRGCDGIKPEVETHEVAWTHSRGHTWLMGA